MQNRGKAEPGPVLLPAVGTKKRDTAKYGRILFILLVLLYNANYLKALPPRGEGGGP